MAAVWPRHRLHCNGQEPLRCPQLPACKHVDNEQQPLTQNRSLPGGLGDKSGVCMPASNLLKPHAAQMEVLICNMRCPGRFLPGSRLTRINVRFMPEELLKVLLCVCIGECECVCFIHCLCQRRIIIFSNCILLQIIYFQGKRMIQIQIFQLVQQCSFKMCRYEKEKHERDTLGRVFLLSAEEL